MSKAIGLLSWLARLGKKNAKSCGIRNRRARLEQLESRAMLTVVSPPQVVETSQFSAFEGGTVTLTVEVTSTLAGRPVRLNWTIEGTTPGATIEHTEIVVGVGDSSEIVLDWSELNALGITNDGFFENIITIEAIDLPAFEGDPDLGTAEPYVSSITIFALDPDVNTAPETILIVNAGECGGGEVEISFEVLSEGPFNTPAYVTGEWTRFVDNVPQFPRGDFEEVSVVSDSDGKYHFTLSGLAPGDYEFEFYAFDDTDDDSPDALEGSIVVTEGGGAPVIVLADSAPVISEGGDFQLIVAGTMDLEWKLVSGGDEITLSDAVSGDNTILTASWTQLATFGITDSALSAFTLELAAVACDCGCGDPEPVDVSLTVGNLAPVVAAIDGPAAGVRLQTLAYSTSFTDLPVDTHTIGWRVLDGADVVVASGAGLNFEFTPETSGSYTVEFTVTDDELDAATVSQTVTITESLVEGDTLYVGGTTGTDSFTITNGPGGQLLINGSPVSGSAGVATIEIILGDGNDVLFVPNSVTVGIVAFGGGGSDVMTAGGGTSILNGGEGNDILLGGSGASVLVGGSGNDIITGGANRDVLIGGAGADLLMGGGGQDLLVDSSTVHDDNVAALYALLAEWTSDTSLASRISRISAGTAGVPRIHSSTTTNDSAIDILMGGGGTDWIAFHSGDLRLGFGDQTLEL